MPTPDRPPPRWLRVGSEFINLDHVVAIEMGMAHTDGDGNEAGGIRVVLSHGSIRDYWGPDADLIRRTFADQITPH